jgi:dihydroneopterin aldolase
MTVEVVGVEIFGRHGANEGERRDGQTFLFDVAIELDEPKEDAIEATVDYRALRDLIRETSDARTYTLIESLAAAVADAIVGSLPVRTVKVRVRKPGVTWAEWTAATVERP